MPFRDEPYTPAGAPLLWVLDPNRGHVQDQAWNLANAWLGTTEYVDALADIARRASLPSGLAARDALIMRQARHYGYDQHEMSPRLMAERRLGWPPGCLTEESMIEVGHIEPSYEDPPGCPLICDCEECHPECGCGDYHCPECHPDGIPDFCDCEECHPDHEYEVEEDDQGEWDDWPGLPAMPDPIPGRCRFGVELEFNGGDRLDIARALQRVGLCVLTEDYNHATARYWKMTTDATVSGGELVSPIMMGDDFSIEQVREAARVIKAHGGGTGRNVGLHVHLDVTDFDHPELLFLVANLQRAQNLLAGFVPEHRYNGDNSYGAELIRPQSWDRIREWITTVNIEDRRRDRENRNSASPISRYTAFNFNSLLTYGTVEVRLLGHTLNTIKIRTWIRTLQSIIVASREHLVIDDIGYDYEPTDVLWWLTQYAGLEQSHADHFRSVVKSRGNDHMLVAA